MLEYLIAGTTLGLAAGISPGPLLVMVVSETLKSDRKEGVKLAFVPLISDLPIVLLSLFVVYKISDSDLVLAAISFLGSAFLVYLSLENLRVKPLAIKKNKISRNSLWKGVLVNLFSPHPYLFWMLVGAPFAIKAYNESIWFAILFVAGFYVFIVGTKITIAFLAEKSKKFISGKGYVMVIKTLGFVLFIFSVILVKDGLKFLGILS